MEIEIRKIFNNYEAGKVKNGYGDEFYFHPMLLEDYCEHVGEEPDNSLSQIYFSDKVGKIEYDKEKYYLLRTPWYNHDRIIAYRFSLIKGTINSDNELIFNRCIFTDIYCSFYYINSYENIVYESGQYLSRDFKNSPHSVLKAYQVTKSIKKAKSNIPSLTIGEVYAQYDNLDKDQIASLIWIIIKSRLYETKEEIKAVDNNDISKELFTDDSTSFLYATPIKRNNKNYLFIRYEYEIDRDSIINPKGHTMEELIVYSNVSNSIAIDYDDDLVISIDEEIIK